MKTKILISSLVLASSLFAIDSHGASAQNMDSMHDKMMKNHDKMMKDSHN